MPGIAAPSNECSFKQSQVSARQGDKIHSTTTTWEKTTRKGTSFENDKKQLETGLDYFYSIDSL